MLRDRFIPALLYGVIFLAALYFGGWAYILLIVLFAVALHREWATINGLAQSRPLHLLSLLAVVAAVLTSTVYGFGEAQVILLAALALILVSGFVADRRGFLSSISLVYFGLPAISLVWLREAPADGLQLSLWMIGIVWMTDIGAYACGRLFGGPKLAPAISPNKTWAGAIGGLLFALAAGAALTSPLGLFPLKTAIILAAILSVAGQIGDLAESKLKRWRGVKDSGTLLNAHGGILDRLDSLLFVAPCLGIAVYHVL